MPLIGDHSGALAAYDKVQAAAGLCLGCSWTESRSLRSLAFV